MLKIKPFVKHLKYHPLKKEYENLINKKYKRISEKKEKRTNEYLKKCILKNLKNDEIIQLKKDIVLDFNETKNLTYLKCKELDRIRTKEGLEGIMITLTNPSKFHPFISNDVEDEEKKMFVSLNENFEFETLENRIDESYQNIKEIYREFYKNVKQKENKNCKFIKIIEPHRSLVCHLHRILYIKRGTYEKVEKKFERIKEKHDLKKCKIEKLKNSKGSSYIIKYLLKNYKTEEIRNFDGYKKLHKIRIFTMSNLKLSTLVFKKLYIRNQELNKKVFEDIKNNNSIYNNLYHFYTENTEVIKHKEYKNIKNLNDEFKNKKRFLVFLKITETEKEKITYKRIFNKKIKEVKTTVLIEKIKIQKIEKFKIFDTIKKQEIYNKDDFKLIKLI